FPTYFDGLNSIAGVVGFHVAFTFRFKSSKSYPRYPLSWYSHFLLVQTAAVPTRSFGLRFLKWSMISNSLPHTLNLSPSLLRGLVIVLMLAVHIPILF